jgi:hypothetical protein
MKEDCSTTETFSPSKGEKLSRPGGRASLFVNSSITLMNISGRVVSELVALDMSTEFDEETTKATEVVLAEVVVVDVDTVVIGTLSLVTGFN